MKLQFDKSGRRFFFLTFALRGRPQVLSRIVEKPGRGGRPGWATALLPPGEAVAALWRARGNYDNCHVMNARNEALCARAAAGSAEAAP